MVIESRAVRAPAYLSLLYPRGKAVTNHGRTEAKGWVRNIEDSEFASKIDDFTWSDRENALDRKSGDGKRLRTHNRLAINQLNQSKYTDISQKVKDLEDEIM